MKKKNFITLVMGTNAGMIFAVGMCMCLLPEWNAFYQGLVVGCIGILFLLITFFTRRKMDGKPMIVCCSKGIKTAFLAICGSLIFGVGMCLTMVWTEYMLYGIIIGCVGILLLLCLIPVCKGLQ